MDARVITEEIESVFAQVDQLRLTLTPEQLERELQHLSEIVIPDLVDSLTANPKLSALKNLVPPPDSAEISIQRKTYSNQPLTTEQIRAAQALGIELDVDEDNGDTFIGGIELTTKEKLSPQEQVVLTFFRGIYMVAMLKAMKYVNTLRQNPRKGSFKPSELPLGKLEEWAPAMKASSEYQNWTAAAATFLFYAISTPQDDKMVIRSIGTLINQVELLIETLVRKEIKKDLDDDDKLWLQKHRIGTAGLVSAIVDLTQNGFVVKLPTTHQDVSLGIDLVATKGGIAYEVQVKTSIFADNNNSDPTALSIQSSSLIGSKGIDDANDKIIRLLAGAPPEKSSLKLMLQAVQELHNKSNLDAKPRILIIVHPGLYMSPKYRKPSK